MKKKMTLKAREAENKRKAKEANAQLTAQDMQIFAGAERERLIEFALGIPWDQDLAESLTSSERRVLSFIARSDRLPKTALRGKDKEVATLLKRGLIQFDLGIKGYHINPAGRDALAEDLQEAYTGMGDPYEKGPRERLLKRKYLDLGKVDPKLAKKGNWGARERILVSVAMLLDHLKGTAFIRDPEGNLERFGLSDPGVFSKQLRNTIEGFYSEQAAYALEADDMEGAAKLNKMGAKAAKAKVTLKAVTGKTGPGYKVTIRPVIGF